MDYTAIAFGLLIGIAGMFVPYLRANARAAAANAQAAERAQTIAALEQRNAAASDHAQQQRDLQALLAPVRDGLERMTQVADAADRRRTEVESRMQAEIRHLRDLSELLGTNTQQLVSAMSKGQSRGQWGEMQLEQLLTYAGLVEGVHFHRQDVRAGDGGTLRPDLVVHLPGGGEILIDAKFPWDAFFEAMGLDDIAARQPLLQKHSRDLAARVHELARKDYSATSAHSPDFVVLFLPLEPLLSTALDQDGTLLEKAFGRKVIPATPTTMVALLRTVAFGWARHDFAVSTDEIRTLSAEMLKRLTITVRHLESTGDLLRRTVDAYNALVGSFDASSIPQARRLADLGVPGGGDLHTPPLVVEAPREVRTAPASDEDLPESRTLSA